MDNEKLNEYIKHYLEEDKTKSAIMLTAPWGSGKSHYIKNTLKPFLEKNGDGHCVVISLYGLKSLADVNRDLYIEMRFNKLNYLTEAQTSGVVFGKTVLKGVTSFFGIDISLSDDEINKLYKSIDFKGKLIIFEDFERSSINTIEFLGYVNNLVEQDGVKVLIVANERELIKYISIEKIEQEEKKLSMNGNRDLNSRKCEYTDETKEYLRIKEKSISDTLTYGGDKKIAINSILSLFENKFFNILKEESIINEIINVFEDVEENNLRSFLFSCQKTSDIYSYCSNEYDDDFIKNIFFGNLIFILKLRRGDSMIWNEENNLSYSLGSAKYPLFKFCYDSITKHSVSKSSYDIAYKEFLDSKLYDMSKSNNDEDLNIIFSFNVKTENDILKSISNIEKRLLDISDISFYVYGTLSNYLICLTQYINCDIEKCLNIMVDNLNGRGDKISQYHLFRSSITIESEEKREIFKKQKELMISALNPVQENLFNFDYNPNSIRWFFDRVYSERSHIFNEKAFMKRLNVKKFVNMIYDCTSEEISIIRQIFQNIYSSSNAYEFFSNEKEILLELIKLLNEYEKPQQFDNIQLMQINYFISNLRKYIDNLSY